jgi:hypothetical protein
MILIYIERYFKTPPRGHTYNPRNQHRAVHAEALEGVIVDDEITAGCNTACGAWTTLKTLKRAEMKIRRWG